MVHPLYCLKLCAKYNNFYKIFIHFMHEKNVHSRLHYIRCMTISRQVDGNNLPPPSWPSLRGWHTVCSVVHHGCHILMPMSNKKFPLSKGGFDPLYYHSGRSTHRSHHFNFLLLKTSRYASWIMSCAISSPHSRNVCFVLEYPRNQKDQGLNGPDFL